MARIKDRLVLVLIATSATIAAADARNRIHVVGSSTVFPYTERVAQEFAKSAQYPDPIVQSTGTGGGMALFCEGEGPRFPDITGASRAMTRNEWDVCRRNGVYSISELIIGLDGLTLATSKETAAEFSFTLRDLYTALAARVPVDGKIVPNPYRQWSEIRPDLPSTDIVVVGPPETSGTRDAFVELAMRRGCDTYSEVRSLQSNDEGEWRDVCSTMRTDGAYIEADEDDNKIVERLQNNTEEVGIFCHSYYFNNDASLDAIEIEGVQPDFSSIATADYPLSRPLFIYIKNDHREFVPGLQDFIAEFRRGSGKSGYLFASGLVPLSDSDLEFVLTAAEIADPMAPPEK